MFRNSRNGWPKKSQRSFYPIRYTMKIIAEVIKIFPMQEFGDKDKPFKKQTVVFEELQEVERPNQIAIDFQQEKIIFSDDLKIGDIVTVFFSTVVNETDKG